MSTPDLDYFQLLKSAKRLDPSTCRRILRIALLADCATQQLATLLRVLLHRAGVHAEIHEAGFDAMETEVLDPGSALYAFRPDVLVFLPTVNALRERWYRAPGDKAGFAAETLERVAALWEAVRRHTGAWVIQSNFARPYERLFGSYDHLVEGSLTDVVGAVNRGLAERARGARNVLVNDVEGVASWIGRRAWFDEKLWVLARSPCALEALPHLAKGVADVAAAAAGAIGVKCVVVDLDDTLWGGIVGDDGVEGLRIGDGGEGEAFATLQRFLRELKRRGILLAVASKNDPANAVRPFRERKEMVLTEEDFSVFLANWDDKAANLRRIRETLNIGFDSMVFLDDNPFERNLVREILPEVIVPELPEDPADFVKALCERNLFETASWSEFDRKRAQAYAVEAQRQALRGRFANADEYLASLDMRITIARFDPANLPRIAQLIQRSNQFNLATRRYSEAQCEALMRDTESAVPLHVSLRDRLGDHGLIGVVVLRRDGSRLVVDELLLSCRVLQRGVEQYVMNEVFATARRLGAEVVDGVYRPTAKNGMVKDFYARFGFTKTEEDGDGNARWSLEVARYVDQATRISPAA